MSPAIIVGSQGFAESDILAQVYGQVLAPTATTVTYAEGIGSRETFIPALQDGSINLIPDYSGNLLYGADPQATATSSDDVDAALPDAVASIGLAVLESAPAQDADALVVTSEFSQKNNVTEIGDLAAIASKITIGANTEFEGRPYGRTGLESVYGVKGWKFKAIDDYGGPGTLSDLLAGQHSGRRHLHHHPVDQGKQPGRSEGPEEPDRGAEHRAPAQLGLRQQQHRRPSEPGVRGADDRRAARSERDQRG